MRGCAHGGIATTSKVWARSQDTCTKHLASKQITLAEPKSLVALLASAIRFILKALAFNCGQRAQNLKLDLAKRSSTKKGPAP